MADNPGSDRINWNEETLVFTYHKLMTDAIAEGNIERYYYYFISLFDMLLAYMPASDQQKCQRDKNNLTRLLYELETGEANENVRKTKKGKLLLDFADNHKLIISEALRRRGWQKPEIEAELNLDELPPDKLQMLVQSKENEAIKVDTNGAKPD